MEEIWKDIQGYEGLYQISNFGRVWSIKSHKCLTHFLDVYGYPLVSLKSKSKKVHRLVASAFIPNPNNLPNVLHKDDNPSNFDISNLVWGTQLDNLQDRDLKGRQVSVSNASQMHKSKLCPYCNKTISIGNYARWHGVNCKNYLPCLR